MQSEVLNEFGLTDRMHDGTRSLNMSSVTSGDLCSNQISLKSNLMVEGEKEIDYVHPLQRALDRCGPKRDEILRLRSLAAESGLAVPLKLAMERKILRHLTPRLPGMHGEHPLLAQIEGRLDDLGFEDFLGTHEFKTEIEDPHFLMEKKLGLLRTKNSNRLGID